MIMDNMRIAAQQQPAPAAANGASPSGGVSPVESDVIGSGQSPESMITDNMRMAAQQPAPAAANGASPSAGVSSVESDVIGSGQSPESMIMDNMRMEAQRQTAPGGGGGAPAANPVESDLIGSGQSPESMVLENMDSARRQGVDLTPGGGGGGPAGVGLEVPADPPAVGLTPAAAAPMAPGPNGMPPPPALTPEEGQRNMAEALSRNVIASGGMTDPGDDRRMMTQSVPDALTQVNPRQPDHYRDRLATAPPPAAGRMPAPGPVGGMVGGDQKMTDQKANAKVEVYVPPTMEAARRIARKRDDEPANELRDQVNDKISFKENHTATAAKRIAEATRKDDPSRELSARVNDQISYKENHTLTAAKRVAKAARKDDPSRELINRVNDKISFKENHTAAAAGRIAKQAKDEADPAFALQERVNEKISRVDDKGHPISATEEIRRRIGEYRELPNEGAERLSAEAKKKSRQVKKSGSGIPEADPGRRRDRQRRLGPAVRLSRPQGRRRRLRPDADRSDRERRRGRLWRSVRRRRRRRRRSPRPAPGRRCGRRFRLAAGRVRHRGRGRQYRTGSGRH